MQSIEQPRRQYAVVGQRQQARTQGEQVAGEVAAVHRRDVARKQRPQRLRVVPVVEMALVTFERRHGGEGVGRALDQPSGREIAEIVGGQVRQQRQSHIGRRGAVRNGGSAIFLEVVRRQPMVGRADEVIEEGPGPPRQHAQEGQLSDREGGLATREGLAEPPGEGR